MPSTEGHLHSPSGHEAVDSGPLISLRWSVSRNVFRLGPAWSVIAGAAVAAPTVSASSVARLAAAVILVELGWGAIRQPAAVEAVADAGGSVMPGLPYARSDAPLARFLRSVATGRAAWQGIGVGLFVSAVLSALLGAGALVPSVAALAAIWLEKALPGRRALPALASAILDVALPWSLGLALFAPVGAAGLRLLASALAVAAGFSIVQWGVYRVQSPTSARALIWLGEAVVLLALVGAGRAVSVAIVAALLSGASYWVLQPLLRGLARAMPWWWIAMLAACLSCC